MMNNNDFSNSSGSFSSHCVKAFGNNQVKQIGINGAPFSEIFMGMIKPKSNLGGLQNHRAIQLARQREAALRGEVLIRS